MALDSDNLQRAEAQFRGTQAPSMVHGTNEHRTNKNMIVLTIHARGADHLRARGATAAPLPGSWCVHNTACRTAAYHGGSEALPGVEDPGSRFDWV